MKRSRGSARGRARAGHGGDAEARARVEALFELVDRLTPDELGRIGLERMDPRERAALLREVASAARRAGRSVLLTEARTLARDRLLERYSSGGLNPTWITLNWGVSQGSAEGRVALIEAIEDAAAAAVVADVADAEVVDALSLDAERVTGLAAGHASDGSFERVLAAPAAEYGDGWPRWVAVGLGALLLGSFAFTLAAFLVGAAAGFVVFVAVAAAVVVAARRRTPPVADPDATRLP